MAFRTIDNPNAIQGAFKGTRVLGVNNNNELVGYYSTNTSVLAFSEIGGVFTTLTAPAAGLSAFGANGVNDSGQIIGEFDLQAGGYHGYILTGGTYTILDNPNAAIGGATSALGINNLGTVVGSYSAGNGVVHGFRYSSGTYTNIDVPLAKGTWAQGINNSGEIVGTFEDSNDHFHGFTLINGVFTTLDDTQATGDTWAYGVNDLGQVVGRYSDAAGQHGYVYSGGTFTTVDEPNAVVLPQANTVTNVMGINNSGRMAGFYFSNPSNPHGFLTGFQPTPNDFGGDSMSDLLWRSADGALVEWQMNGGAIVGNGMVTYQGSAVTPDASWSNVASSDFDGDGRADMLWRNGNGALALWQMNGSTITSSNAPAYQGAAASPDASWSVAATADFSGDGKADILWRQNNGSLVLWSMNGSSILSTSALTHNGNAVAPDASWSVAGTGDFDGNGKADLLWRRSSTGALAVWSMDGATVKSGPSVIAQGNLIRPDASWSVAAIGDFGGDGDADVLWRQSATGALALWQMNGNTVNASSALTYQGNVVAPDASWKIVEIGDFNGDGNSDILWRNDNGTMTEWLMNGSQITATQTPSSQGIPAAPDANWTVQSRPTNFG